jgi:hypothetical protein
LRIVLNDAGTVILFSEGTYRGDRVRLDMKLR